MNDSPETNHSSRDDSTIGNLSNAKDNAHHDPLKFVDTISDQKHIVLFYEVIEAARIVEYRYLRNGCEALLIFESCSLLFRFLGNGKSEEGIKIMLTEINNIRCVPSPLPV